MQGGDFVYFDSPFVPVSETANFMGYTKDGSTREDHKRLGALRGLEQVRNRSIRSGFSRLEVAAVADPQHYCMDVDTPEDARKLAARLEIPPAVEV